MLIELPNGDWLDPAEVISIKFQPRENFGHYFTPGRVVVSLRGGDRIAILMDDAEAAFELVRRIAGKVNKARGGE